MLEEPVFLVNLLSRLKGFLVLRLHTAARADLVRRGAREQVIQRVQRGVLVGQTVGVQARAGRHVRGARQALRQAVRPAGLQRRRGQRAQQHARHARYACSLPQGQIPWKEPGSLGDPWVVRYVRRLPRLCCACLQPRHKSS